MIAAKTLAERGVKVTLIDRQNELGGTVNLAKKPPLKERMSWIADYYKVEFEKLGVEVKLGVEATGKNMNDLKLQKAHEDKVAQENLDAAKAFAEELKDKQVTVGIKVGEGGRTFGSISAKEIAEAAKAQLGYELDKKKMVLPEPIKSPGIFDLPIKLHPKVMGSLKVIVQETK